MKAITAIAPIRKMMMKKVEIAPVRPSSRKPAIAEGRRATMPAKMIS